MEDIKAVDSIANAEETFSPEPSAEQNQLWDKLDAAYDVPALEHEATFMALSDNDRSRLASIELAEDISRIAMKLNLDSKNTRHLSAIMKYVGIKEIEPADAVRVALELIAPPGTEKETVEREVGALVGVSVMREEPIPSPPSTVDSVAAPAPSVEEIPTESIPETTIPSIGMGDEPFILHEEEPEYIRPEPRESPSVNFNPGQIEKRTSPKPVTAKVESPERSPRVVHYSDLKTKLDE
ncbi:MAG: hypothetical protein AAB518_00265 [Patescibacteria group bacterium]